MIHDFGHGEALSENTKYQILDTIYSLEVKTRPDREHHFLIYLLSII